MTPPDKYGEIPATYDNLYLAYKNLHAELEEYKRGHEIMLRDGAPLVRAAQSQLARAESLLKGQCKSGCHKDCRCDVCEYFASKEKKNV